MRLHYPLGFSLKLRHRLMENDTIIMQTTEVIEKIKGTSLSEWFPHLLKEYLIPFGIRLLLAFLVYLVGRWVVRMLKKGLERIMIRRQTDKSLMTFLKSLVSILLNFILIVAIISVLGIDTTSLVALLASAGLAIGMALSGTLQNFAGGVIIMLFRPYRVGDFIEAQGQMGTVKEIQIFNTIILTIDNKFICIPNGGLSTGILINYSKEERRRVDWTFSISYGDDYDLAKSILKRLCDADQRILKDPEVFIELLKLNDSSVDITVRAWVYTPDYWPVFFSMNEKVYKSFPAEGLNLPFPQIDVHLKNNG
jgi:Small-conductance mechanosensitive channel